MPTVSELRASLTRLVRDGFDDFWASMCARAAVSPMRDLPPAELSRLCTTIIDNGGIAAIGARGIAVRLTTASILNRK